MTWPPWMPRLSCKEEKNFSFTRWIINEMEVGKVVCFALEWSTRSMKCTSWKLSWKEWSITSESETSGKSERGHAPWGHEIKFAALSWNEKDEKVFKLFEIRKLSSMNHNLRDCFCVAAQKVGDREWKSIADSAAVETYSSINNLS